MITVIKDSFAAYFIVQNRPYLLSIGIGNDDDFRDLARIQYERISAGSYVVVGEIRDAPSIGALGMVDDAIDVTATG